MIVGLDTTVLVQLEVKGAPGHLAAQKWLRSAIGRGDRLAIAPQILTEFLHVVTDPARFASPLEMPAAVGRGEAWWNSTETVRVFPTETALEIFGEWMRSHQLGRKRLLDTMLAATYFANGITDIATSNARDYKLFNVFRIHRI